MKFSSAAIIVLSALHSANALVSGPRPHSVSGRPSLQSSKLFSSAAASSHLSVGNSVGLGLNNDVAASSTGIAAAAVSAEESYNLNYGPGKCVSYLVYVFDRMKSTKIHIPNLNNHCLSTPLKR